MDIEPQTTLRDQLAANLAEVEETTPVETGVVDEAVIGEEPKEVRQRDGQGRFAKTEPVEAAPVDEAPKPKINRPSTWKKDHWDSFDKLASENPTLAEYINQREGEFAKGVSTYKQEAERAKNLWGALEPFMPELQQHRIDPAQWISNLGRAHQTLAMGNPQQKLEMFQKLARDYGVPIQALSPQAGEGQSPDVLQWINPLYEQVNQLKGQLTSWQSQQEQSQQQVITQEIQKFAETHPHLEQVRETMSGLLQSGLAQDLQSAYDAAIRMPRHDDIFQELQKQQREESERKAAEEKRAAAERARKNTVSPRSGTPTARPEKANGKTGLREMLEEQFDAHSSGRV